MGQKAVQKSPSAIKAILRGLEAERPSLVQRWKELIHEVSSVEDEYSRSEQEIRKSFMEVHADFYNYLREKGIFEDLLQAYSDRNSIHGVLKGDMRNNITVLQ